MRWLGIFLGFCVGFSIGTPQQSDVAWRQPLISGYAMAVSPDGQLLAVAAEGGQIALYRVSDKQLIGVLRGNTGEVQAIAFSPNSQRFASLDDAGWLILWDINTKSPVWNISAHGGVGLSVAFAPNGSAIATGGTDNRVAVWNPSNGAPIRTLTGHTAGVSALAFSPNSVLLASADQGGELRIWNSADGALVHAESNAHLDAINAIAWSPSGTQLASGGSDRRIHLWTVGTWAWERVLTNHTDTIYSLMFAPDSTSLFSASADNTLRQWNPDTGDEIRVYNGHTGEVRGVALAGSGQIASCSTDRTVRFWQTATGNNTATISGHKGTVRGVAFVSGGYALSGDEQGVLQLWNASNGAAGPSLSPHANPILAIAFTSDGSLVAIGDSTGIVSLRAMPTGATVTSWSAHNEEIFAVAFSPNGQLLATASFDGTAKLWQIPGGTLLRTFGGHTGAVNAVAFSPDGTQIVTGDALGTIRFWGLDGTPLTTLNAHTEAITALAFRPTGAHLASSSIDGTVRIWDLATNTEYQRLTGDGSSAMQVAYTPDGSQIVWSVWSGIVYIADAGTGNIACQVNAHSGEARALAVSPDGTLLFSGGADGVAMLYTSGPPNRPPSVPTPIAPAEGATVSRTPTFEVQVSDPDGDLVRAIIEVVDSQNRSRTLRTEWTTGGSVTVAIPSGQPLDPGAYRWRAYAEDERGATSASSSWRNFTVSNSAPGKPVILEPGDNAQVSATPTFRLRLDDPDGDRVRADIEILQNANPVRAFTTDLVGSGQEIAFTVPNTQALEPGTYQWRTRARDTHGAQSDWTANRTFTVPGANRPPDVPTRLSPSDGATVNPTPTFRLRLSDSDNQPVKAEIEIVTQGTTRTYQTNEVSSGSEVSFSIPPGEGLSAGTYLWRARARDSVGEWSQWTDQWQFTVAVDNQPPAMPTVLEPADGAITGPTPTFQVRLSDPDNEQVYAIIQLRRSDNAWIEFRTETVASGQTISFTPPQALDSGEYSWVARAVDARNAQSDWSQPYALTVNRLPNTPTLLSPSDNTFTSRTPILRLRADDPEGDSVRLEIELTDGTRTWRYITDQVPSGTVVSYPMPEEEPLNAGQISWRARAQDSFNAWGDWSATQTFHTMNEIAPQLLGITDFALNLNVSNPTPDALGLGSATIVRWNPTQGSYESVSTLRAGEGYFLRVPNTTRLDLTGTPVDGSASIELQTGWNLIANPYLLPLNWDLDSIQVRRGNTTLSLRSAHQEGWLDDYLWTWQQNPNDPMRGQYQLVYDARVLPGVLGVLEPWQAYWILAREACTLILNPPTRTRTFRPRPNGWSLQIQAIGAHGSSQATFGVGRALLANEPPQAPDQNGVPRIRFRRMEGSFIADLRDQTTRARTWQMEVVVPPGDTAQTITLQVSRASALPHGVHLALADEQTGRRIPLRGRATYTFTAPAEGGLYRLRVEPMSMRAYLRVLNPTVQGGRAYGGVYRIGFTLTDSADVQVQIRSAGHVVRTLISQAHRSAGSQQVVWDGRDDAGRTTPPGQYLVEITAVSEDGQVARAILPLITTR